MNWRLASRLSVVTFAILVVILVTLFQRRPTAPVPTTNTDSSGSATTSGLQGTDLGSTPAPDFRLLDQSGKQIALTDFKGKPVVLTFLYTHCPDVCPLTAEKLHTALQSMGQDAQHVGIIAVSTDPKRDTAEAALNFSKAHNMQDTWHYLIGNRSQLEPVWSNYHIYAKADQQTVSHSQGIYILDKQGRERVFLGDDFKPEQVSANLHVLLKE